MSAITLHLDPELHARIRDAAGPRHGAMARWIRAAIERALAEDLRIPEAPFATEVAREVGVSPQRVRQLRARLSDAEIRARYEKK